MFSHDVLPCFCEEYLRGDIPNAFTGARRLWEDEDQIRPVLYFSLHL